MITLTHNRRIVTHHSVPVTAGVGNAPWQLVHVPHGPNAPFNTLEWLPNGDLSPTDKPLAPHVASIGTIAQLSDLHFYENTDPAYYNAVLSDLHQLQPDVIALTGDTIHHGNKYVGMMGDFMAQLPEKSKKIAILGNHDYADHAQSRQVQATWEQANIEVLVNQSTQVTVGDTPMTVVGLDDLRCGQPNVAQAFANVATATPVLALIHNPLLMDRLAAEEPIVPFLTLSGHTHAGHVYIPALKPIYRHVLGHKYRYGFYNVRHRASGQAMPLYVTSGLGGAAYYLRFGKFQRPLPRFRWNTYPEIAVFNLINPSC